MSTFTQLEKIRNVILASPALKSVFLPASRVFTKAAGYREMGLKTEDLFAEENEVVSTALRRLPSEDSYKRIYRIAVAFQASINQQLAPVVDRIKPEEDTSYLVKHLLEAEAQIHEREELDNLTVKPSKKT